MDSRRTPSEILSTKLLTWNGITTQPGRFGAVAFHYGHREVRHVHGNSHADLPFPTSIRDDLVQSGLAQEHPFLPASGRVTSPLQGEGAREQTLDLFRRNYDLIVRKKQVAETTEAG